MYKESDTDEVLILVCYLIVKFRKFVNFNKNIRKKLGVFDGIMISILCNIKIIYGKIF